MGWGDVVWWGGIVGLPLVVLEKEEERRIVLMDLLPCLYGRYVMLITESFLCSVSPKALIIYWDFCRRSLVQRTPQEERAASSVGLLL